MLMDPHPNWQLQQEVTRPKARFKPTSPKKSGVAGETEVSIINLFPVTYITLNYCKLSGN